jgi:pyruvate ferredoxin oxidoreductase delta subunit
LSEEEFRRKQEELNSRLNAGWNEIPHALIIFEPGNSRYYRTGDWKTFKPVIDKNKCTKCGLCWIYCPDGAICPAADGGYEVDLNYCKGCGICSEECPVKAISMVQEER